MKLDLPNIIAHMAAVDPKDTTWFDRASCKGMDPAMFLPERGDSLTLNKAKETCADCPVKWNCLRFGVGERIGIWGGFSEKQRRAINTAWNRYNNGPLRGPQRQPIRHGTWQGYQQHRARGEDACKPCRQAKLAYEQDRRAARKENAS